jgi:hypothetical protein
MASMSVRHLSRTELEAGLPEIIASPKDVGVVALVVQRPAVGERRVVDSGVLSVDDGLVGDNWKARGSGMTPGRKSHPEMQLNVMNARAAALVAQNPDRWALAGDQLYVDLDLSLDNLPPESRLRVGNAVIEVTAIPHRGCRKFVQRFGRDAMEFVNSDLGCRLNLRGINAKVIEGGEITVNDRISVEKRGAKAVLQA